jgi:hypothetical protein
MIIRNFVKPVHCIEDITNILDRRRFVIIYEYPDCPHKTAYEIYTNHIYDIFVINISTVLGSDYIIPKGIVVQYKNVYRGKVLNPFNPDGSFNLSATCIFNSSSFSTRIVNGRDIFRVNKKDLIMNGTYENYISNLLKSDTLTPLPVYYNIEDQARLSTGEHKDIDFDVFLNNSPNYTLNNFRDTKTSFITLEIHEDNLLQNNRDILSLFSKPFYPNLISDSDKYIINSIGDRFMDAFLSCYDIVTVSIFAQVYIIIDLYSGLMNIPKDSLTLKYAYNVNMDEVSKEYLYLKTEIDGIVVNLFESVEDDYYDICSNPLDETPTRIMFYISPSRCKIKFTDPYNRKNIRTSSDYSASDVDESSTSRDLGDTMYPSEYNYYGIDGIYGI